MLGKDGAFAPLLESILNAALEGEMDAHLSEDERMSGNRRNGKIQKQVQTSMSEVTVSTPVIALRPLNLSLLKNERPFLRKVFLTA